VDRVLAAEVAGRPRVQALDDLERLRDLLDRALALLGDGLEVALLELLKELDHEPLSELAVVLEVVELEEEALFQVAGGDADGIEFLNLLQHALHMLDRNVQADGDVLAGPLADQEAAVVERTDDLHGDRVVRIDQLHETELPDEVIVERLGPRERLLEVG